MEGSEYFYCAQVDLLVCYIIHSRIRLLETCWDQGEMCQLTD